ncbi:MAG: hypothetical protein RL660_2550 [Bacteroidota bacterium]
MKKCTAFQLSYKLICLLGLLCLVQQQLSAQTTNINGVINSYSGVTAINGGNNILTLNNATPFAAGDLILIVQMKGALINTTTSANTFGTINGVGIAGTHEFATIQSINGVDATLQYTLCNTYDVNNLVQIVKVVPYVDANINGQLTCTPWNGSYGGILVVLASGTITFNADINVDSAGFLGGAVCNGGFGCSSSGTFVGTSAFCGGGFKGEGISLMPIGSFPTNLAKLANGGGGSNNGNNGGAGGANGGAGGRSGDEYSGCATTNVWAIGGDPVPVANNRLLMGGGGGGGFADNGSVVTPGGNAGGTVMLFATSIQGNNFTIHGKGQNVSVIAADEGSGGGGAGGSVYLHCTNFPSTLNIDLTGGYGGSNFNNTFTGQCHGTGGGGGGGQVWVQGAVFPATINTILTGGAAGTVNNPLSSCFGTTYNAVAGSDGTTNTNLAPIAVGSQQVNLGNDTTICDGVPFILNPGLFSNYQWSNGATSPTITASTSGTYWVSVQGCGGNNSSDTINITFLQSPQPNLGATKFICSYNTVTLSPGIYPDILWNTGATTNSITVNTSGTYSVLVTDANGCTGTDNVNVVVTPLDALVVANAPDSLCINNPLVLSSTSVGNPVTYTWNMGDGTIINGGNSVSHTYGAYGTYVYELFIQNLIGCVDSITDSVYVASAYPVFFRALDETLCLGEPVYLYDSLTELSSGWLYTFGDGTSIANENDPIHAYANVGNYTITLASNNLVCPPTVYTVGISVEDGGIVNLGPDTSYCDGYSIPIPLSNLAGVGGTNNLWNTGSTTSTIAVTSPGTYWLQTRTPNGCLSADTVMVKSDCYLNIPNAFTPNGDGMNNRFIPLDMLSSGVTSFNMEIYNRWGEQVFVTNNINSSGWDGKFGNKPQPMGVYVYMINVAFKNGTSKKFTGNVTLIR